MSHEKQRAMADKDTKLSSGIEELDKILQGDKRLDLSLFATASPKTNLLLEAMRAALSKGETLAVIDLEGARDIREFVDPSKE